MDGRKYQRKSGIKRTLVMLLALVLMTSAFIPGLTARAAEEPATPPEGEEETLTLEKVLENPPTDYETSTEYLNNLDTLVQKLDVDCTKDDCKALYDAVVKAQALIAELTLTEEQETAFTKLAEDILTCLKEEKGYKPEEEEEITPLSDPEPTPDPVCPGDDTCTIEGCTNHAPKCPGDDTCTIEGCTNHAPKCPGDDTCTIEGCAVHDPVCPGDGCTIDGCPNHGPVCENCQGAHETEECPLCPDCGEESCVCDPVCLTCGGEHETWNCPDNIPIAYATSDASPADGLEISKTATKRLDEAGKWDGSYDLELTLKGSVDTEEKNKLVDLLIVIDRSWSMSNTDGTGKTRLQHALDARKKLIETLEDSKKEIEQFRYNIVDFSGYGLDPNYNQDGFDEVHNMVGWSGWCDADKAMNHSIVLNQFYWPSTNYEAAFRKVNDQLQGARPDALKAVVFLTDGKPTVAWANVGLGWAGHGTSSEENENVQACMTAAEDELNAMVADRFYIVGIGTSTEFVGDTKTTVLDRVYSAATRISPENKKVYTPGTSGLVDQFGSIGTMLSKLFYTEVLVTDTLHHENNVSTNPLMVKVLENKEPKVSVKNANDEVIAGPAASVTIDNATLTAVHNGDNLCLDFPDTYQLNPEYTYVLSAQIEPTERAYRIYRQNGYSDTGDSQTGTHANDRGFYSNDKATVSYSYGGVTYDGDDAMEYAKPVIQLTPGTLTINKSIEGLTAEQIAAITDLKFNVTLTYPDDGNGVADEEVTKEIPLSEMTQENGVYTYSFKGLSPGTQFVVTEYGGEVAEYTMTTKDAGIAAADDTCITAGDGKCAENCVLHSKITNSSNSDKTVSGTVGRGKEVTARFTNTYSIAVTSVTVEKQVTGNMGDQGKGFTFTYKVGANDSEHTFVLKHGEIETLENLKIGETLYIKEDTDYVKTVTYTVEDEQGKPKTTTVEVKDGWYQIPVAAGTVVNFNNTRNANIDTGIVTDSIPYILLLTMAVIGADVLLLNKRRGY